MCCPSSHNYQETESKGKTLVGKYIIYYAQNKCLIIQWMQFPGLVKLEDKIKDKKIDLFTKNGAKYWVGFSMINMNKGSSRGPNNARNDGNKRIKFLCRNTNFIFKDTPLSYRAILVPEMSHIYKPTVTHPVMTRWDPLILRCLGPWFFHCIMSFLWFVCVSSCVY